MKKLTLFAFLFASLISFSQVLKPSVSAGDAQTITLPSSVTLSGSACVAGQGSISKYMWTKSSGPSSYSFSNASSAITVVSNLAKGTYVFKLSATDNAGATIASTVTITVNAGIVIPPPNNSLPRAYAGENTTITLPENTAALPGRGTDADGVIISYKWTKETGDNAIIVNPGIGSTTVTGLSAGSYRFRLTVTDNAGGSSSDTVNITVKPSVVIPVPPLPPIPGSYGTLIYSTGYNTVADLDPYSNGQWGSGTLGSHLSTSIYRDGPGAFKSVPANVSSGIRSEVQYPSSLTPIEGVIEYDVMYETIFQNSGHSLQFHPNTSGGSASPGLWHENGKWVWVNWKGGDNTKYPTNFTIPQNKWMHCVFEYKIGSAGYMKFTVDGVVLLDRQNIQVGDGSGQYLKVGVNMWEDQSSVVYYDNLKIWKKDNSTWLIWGSVSIDSLHAFQFHPSEN